jgi:hypothetical protein
MMLSVVVVRRPSPVSRARFVAAGAIDLKLCTCIPRSDDLTDQISV